MVVIDTTVWIDYLNGVSTPEAEWLDFAVDTQRLATTDLNICEVLQGIREDGDFRLVRRQLLRFEILSAGGAELAIEAASNYRRLRKAGYTVRRTVDCLIATVCLTGGHQLLHNDRDFDPFEQVLGLQVVHP